MADWLPACLAGWVDGWLTGWLAAWIAFSMRLLVSAPGQNAEANPTNSDDREAKQTPELFGERDLTKPSLFWQTGLGWAALTLGWARTAQPRLGLG